MYDSNPSFTRTAKATIASDMMTLFVRFKPQGYWTDDAVTLTINTQGNDASTSINFGSGGQDNKSGLSHIERTECFAAALGNAIELAKDAERRVKNGESSLSIAQSFCEMDLPSTSKSFQLTDCPAEVPVSRLPNDLFMCAGMIWRDKSSIQEFLKSKNPEAVTVEMQISHREIEYWWFMISNRLVKVLGYEDIPTLG